MNTNISSAAAQFINDVNAKTLENVKPFIGYERSGGNEFDDAYLNQELTTHDFFDIASRQNSTGFIPSDQGHGGSKKTRKNDVKFCELHHHGRYIVLSGGVGYGKTTLLRKYCSLKLSNVASSDLKLVHLLNMKDVADMEQTPQQFLFDYTFKGTDETDCVEEGYKWLKDEINQEGVLFVFDGLETAAWNLNADEHDTMAYSDKKCPSTILNNILSGNLFPRCNILVAARENTIVNFPRAIHPDQVIELQGYDLSTIKSIILECNEDNGIEIWKEIFLDNALLELCSIPLYLMLIVMISQESKIPNTIMGIITFLFQNYMSDKSNSSSKCVNVKATLEKLEELAFRGIAERKRNFDEEHLIDLGIELEEVEDLVFSAPITNRGSYDFSLLMKGTSYYFCHKSFQDVLAALHILHLDWSKFQEFARTSINLKEFFVVRQFLCGMLFNEGVGCNDEGTATAKKRDLVLEILHSQIAANLENPMQILNIIRALNECHKNKEIIDLIRQSLDKVVLSGIPLAPGDLHAISTVVSLCRHIRIVQLEDCKLEKHSIKILLDGLKGSDVEILVFDVSFNNKLRKDSLPYIREICLRGQGLNYWQCGFKQYDILSFHEDELEIAPVEYEDFPHHDDCLQHQFHCYRVLELSFYNVRYHYDVINDLLSEKMNIGIRADISEFHRSHDVSKLCALAQKCEKIDELAIARSDMTKEQLLSVSNSITNKKIKTLNVLLSPNIDQEAWVSFGRLLSVCNIANLFLTACAINDMKLKYLSLDAADVKIDKLDVSRNDQIDKKCMTQLAAIIRTWEVSELVMGYCNLTGAFVGCFAQQMSKCRMTRIDVSGNEGMGPDGFQALGTIVHECGVKLVDISECNPNFDELIAFKKAVKYAQIRKLNVSRNRNMGAHGLKVVGQLVGQCNIEELFVRQCELELDTLHAFREGLGDHMIPFLDFGLYFMKSRPVSTEESQAFLDILPLVGKQLTLNAWDFGSEARSLFRSVLDELPFRGLKIVFNRGKNEFIQQMP